MSNWNIITPVLATIGAARLTTKTAAAAYRHYLNHRIGTEFETWRTNGKRNRDRRNAQEVRNLAALCERHGLTGTARLFHWLADTADKTDSETGRQTATSEEE